MIMAAPLTRTLRTGRDIDAKSATNSENDGETVTLSVTMPLMVGLILQWQKFCASDNESDNAMDSGSCSDIETGLIIDTGTIIHDS